MTKRLPKFLLASMLVAALAAFAATVTACGPAANTMTGSVTDDGVTIITATKAKGETMFVDGITVEEGETFNVSTDLKKGSVKVIFEIINGRTGETIEVISEDVLTSQSEVNVEVEPGQYFFRVFGTDDDPATGTINVWAGEPTISL